MDAEYEKQHSECAGRRLRHGSAGTWAVRAAHLNRVCGAECGAAIVHAVDDRGWLCAGRGGRHRRTGGVLGHWALSLLLHHHPRLHRHAGRRSEEHTSELQSRENLVCRLLLEKKKVILEYTT